MSVRDAATRVFSNASGGWVVVLHARGGGEGGAPRGPGAAGSKGRAGGARCCAGGVGGLISRIMQQSTCVCACPSPGSYSSNVNLAVENSSWSDEQQLQVGDDARRRARVCATAAAPPTG